MNKSTVISLLRSHSFCKQYNSAYSKCTPYGRVDVIVGDTMYSLSVYTSNQYSAEAYYYGRYKKPRSFSIFQILLTKLHSYEIVPYIKRRCK